MSSSGISECRRSSSVTYGWEEVISSIYFEIVETTKYGSFGGAKTGQMPRYVKGLGKSGTYLAVSDLLKGLEDLFCSVLIFSNIDHEANELLERHVTLASTSGYELLMHLVLIID